MNKAEILERGRLTCPANPFCPESAKVVRAGEQRDGLQPEIPRVSSRGILAFLSAARLQVDIQRQSSAVRHP